MELFSLYSCSLVRCGCGGRGGARSFSIPWLLLHGGASIPSPNIDGAALGLETTCSTLQWASSGGLLALSESGSAVKEMEPPRETSFLELSFYSLAGVCRPIP